MSSLIVLLGSLILFGNPDIQTDTIRGEVAYFKPTGIVKAGLESLGGKGAFGWGASLRGEYLDRTSVRHSLGIQRFENSQWKATIFNIGADYFFHWPNRPFQLATGLEIGSGQLEPINYKLIKTGNEQYGLAINAEAQQYFVLRDRLMHGFIRPSWKVYDLEIDANGKVDTIYGRTPSIAGGIGFRF